MPILVFLGLSLLDIGPMYATDRQIDRRQTKTSLNSTPIRFGGILIIIIILNNAYKYYLICMS